MKLIIFQILTLNCCMQLSYLMSLNNENPTFLKPWIEYRNNSQFGYTIAAYGTEKSNQKLLVGAPQSSSSQKGVSTPGALYSCEVGNSTGPCEQLDVDKHDADKLYDDKMKEDIKDYQRLGASLSVHNNATLVCAPNWHYDYVLGVNRRAHVGKCFYSENLNDFTPFSPVVDRNTTPPLHHQYYDDGYCQVGLSVSIDSKTDEAVMGAPGCYAWIGDVFIGPAGSSVYKRRGREYKEKDFLPDEDTNARIIKVAERYTGYNVAVGTFRKKTAYVVSSPRATVITQELDQTAVGPVVLIFMKKNETHLKTWKQIHTGRNDFMFAYCGYSIAVGDVNGDGLDDIVVGCPLYGTSSNGDKGAMIVLYQRQTDDNFDVIVEDISPLRMGGSRGDRFGTAVAVLEDIDGDGYNDVAVGAPFANDGSGAVYIYCGQNGDLPSKTCQILTASGSEVRSLGWAIANVANLVAVSAPLSEQVLLYSKLPVLGMYVTGSVEPLNLGIQCIMDDGSKHPCSELTICVRYSVRNVDVDDRMRDFSVSIILDDERETSRLVFLDRKNTKTEVYKVRGNAQDDCKVFTIYYIMENDALMEFLINAEGIFKPQDQSDESIVLDNRSILKYSGILQVLNECEGRNVTTCRADVTVTMTQKGNFTYGESDSIIIEITVSLTGESAFYPKLKVDTEGLLQKSGNVVVEGVPEICKEEAGVIMCNMGGELRPQSQVKYVFRFTPSDNLITHIETATPELLITAEFLTSSMIVRPASAKASHTVHVNINPKIYLSKASSPENIDLAQWSTETSPETSVVKNLGPMVVHEYEVDNVNQYSLYGVSIVVRWPHKHATTGDHLLYIAETPKVIVSDIAVGSCEVLEGGTFDENNYGDKSDSGSYDESSRGSLDWQNQFEGSMDPSVSPLIFRCSVSDLPAKEAAKVRIESYAVFKTFIKTIDNPATIQNIESTAVALVNHVPFNQSFAEKNTASIITSVTYPPTEYWYYIVIGVSVGIAMIIVIGVIIYKTCFKKKQSGPPTVTATLAKAEEAEKQDGDPEVRASLMAGNK